MKIKTVLSGLALAGLTVSGVAQATLIDRGGGLIFDDVLKITWLSDANYAMASGYDVNGAMVWSAANTWAANLTFHDSVRNVNYSDWRLPTALNQDGSGPCSGFNCTNSEMGHMFYNNLGASADSSILKGTNTANLALFTNLQSSVYWFGTTDDTFAPASSAWFFGASRGNQLNINTGYDLYAWAVRSGDVAAIPEPETYLLLLFGLGLMGWKSSRKA